MDRYVKVRGMHDILPEQISKWQSVEKILINTVSLFGYKEIRTPVVEARILFERSIGDGTDIVSKEIYAFKDRKGRDIALRPEGTASVVRAFIESGMSSTKRVFRLYYYGPMFRYDRPQKGRYRQFYQFGVELLGGKHPFFDGEIVVMLDTIAKKLKIKNHYFLINTLGCSRCKTAYSETVKNFFSGKEKELCDDCRNRLTFSPLRILDCKNSQCKQYISDVPVIGSLLCQDCHSHFSRFKEYIEAHNVPYKINPYLVRGLDYYTRTVFELYVDTDENAIAAGGRYDTLVQQLGGPEVPAVGFAIGMERFISLVEYPHQEDKFFYLACIGENAKLKGATIINEIRDKEIKVEADYEERSLGSHLKLASRIGARWCIIIGEDEMKKREFIVRDMVSGKQLNLPMDNYIDIIQGLVK